GSFEQMHPSGSCVSYRLSAGATSARRAPLRFGFVTSESATHLNLLALTLRESQEGWKPELKKLQNLVLEVHQQETVEIERYELAPIAVIDGSLFVEGFLYYRAGMRGVFAITHVREQAGAELIPLVEGHSFQQAFSFEHSCSTPPENLRSKIAELVQKALVAQKGKRGTHSITGLPCSTYDWERFCTHVQSGRRMVERPVEKKSRTVHNVFSQDGRPQDEIQRTSTHTLVVACPTDLDGLLGYRWSAAVLQNHSGPSASDLTDRRVTEIQSRVTETDPALLLSFSLYDQALSLVSVTLQTSVSAGPALARGRGSSGDWAGSILGRYAVVDGQLIHVLHAEEVLSTASGASKRRSNADVQLRRVAICFHIADSLTISQEEMACDNSRENCSAANTLALPCDDALLSRFIASPPRYPASCSTSAPNRVALRQLTAFAHLIGAEVDEQVDSVLHSIMNSTASRLLTRIEGELGYPAFTVDAVRALFPAFRLSVTEEELQAEASKERLVIMFAAAVVNN
ncbi:hypothetical protein B484DRAFT_438041, partial [Ochromonadaceae sp. CCMP2298]